MSARVEFVSSCREEIHWTLAVRYDVEDKIDEFRGILVCHMHPRPFFSLPFVQSTQIIQNSLAPTASSLVDHLLCLPPNRDMLRTIWLSLTTGAKKKKGVG